MFVYHIYYFMWQRHLTHSHNLFYCKRVGFFFQIKDWCFLCISHLHTICSMHVGSHPLPHRLDVVKDFLETLASSSSRGRFEGGKLKKLKKRINFPPLVICLSLFASIPNYLVVVSMPCTSVEVITGKHKVINLKLDFHF